MLIRQSKNTYIRCTEKYGYITNQLTRFDRVYDESGAIFLKHIGRESRRLSSIIDSLCCFYTGVDREILASDFKEFVKDLESVGFIVTGDTDEQLNAVDKDFTYKVSNPKTNHDIFPQNTKECVSENTQDFFLEEIQGHPLISALQLEITTKCNERCIHCYIPNSKKDKGINMPFSLFTRVVDEFASMGGLHITLSGGEAFLHPQISAMLRYCRSKDLKITILSNLLNLKESDILTIKETNVSLIQVSLYSMDENIHDCITTVKGSFTKTKSAIESLVKADVPVQISCPLMKANRDGYRDVLLYAQSLKIKAYTDYIMMAQSNLDKSNLINRLSLSETEVVLRDIISYDFDYHRLIDSKTTNEFKPIDNDRYKKQPVCGVGYDNCCISANGDVYPCAGWQNYILGNVSTDSLKIIWENSERIKQLRRITQESFPQCIECEARDYCARCLVRNYNESGGDMFAINQHFCDVAFLNKRLVEEYRTNRKNDN